jgi:serine/threonine-protein kinase
MKCPKCETVNPDTSSFCADCGTQLGQPKDTPAFTKTLETPFPQLSKGTTLADRYEIMGELGKGGMGEVYLAEDTNLKRQVAIKVLSQQFALDHERLVRFEREARLLASLNHPNIATIHGLEKSDEQQFLVMELVEGDTLRDRISRGPLPIEEALEICWQIAEGLESAHEKGIIHRDLKPANVIVIPEGKAKILDFGIAKAFQDQSEDSDPSKPPVITDEMTRPGVILGTAAYMSPEQTKGKAVDKRSDIWAFGCILYECFTGKRAFKGDTISEMMARYSRGGSKKMDNATQGLGYDILTTDYFFEDRLGKYV